MLEKDPQDSFLLFALAKEYQQNDRLQEAEEYFLKLHQVDPDYIGLYYHLAKNYELLGMNDQAKRTYVEGIEIAKKHKDLHAESELRNALVNLEMDM